MKYLRFWKQQIKGFGWSYAAILLCHLLMVGVSVLYVLLSKNLVDSAVDIYRNAGDWNSLLVPALIFILLTILRPAIINIRSYLTAKISVSMTNRLRQRQFDSLLHMRNEYGNKYHSGDMINRLQNDVSLAASAVSTSLPNVIGAMLQFIAAFVCLLFFEAKLAWTLIVIIPIAVFGSKYIMLKIRNLTLKIRSSDSAVQSHMQESYQHLTVLQTLEYADTSINNLSDLQSENYRNNMQRSRFSVLAHFIVGLGFSLAYAVAFLWGVFGISEGIVTYGLMTAFLQLVGQVQRPLIQISDKLPAIIHSLASVDRLAELENLPKEDASSQIMLGSPAGVRFENLRFAYPGSSETVFDSFSYDFRPGSRTAVVGPTGIGKSTMIRLMLSLLTPSAGKVLLYDGESELPASAALRCNLVYVPQGNSLFSGTIRENLLMGDPYADDEKLRKALHTAAADFVFELPAGLDSVCVEAGGGLSEGQAQRIAIARALLRPGSILLLDEFSSALDAETEELLLERLTKELPSHTMIFITHREKVIDFCDSTLRL